MSQHVQEVDVPAIFNQLEYLDKAQARLYDLAGLLDEEPEATLPLLDVALESITNQSEGSGPLDKVSRAVEVIREAIVRLFRSLFYGIKDLIVNYRNRVESLHTEVNRLQERADAMVRGGTLTGVRSGTFDHLPIAQALFKAPRVTYVHLRGELGSFNTYIKLIQDVTRSRSTGNQTLLSSLKSVKGTRELRDLITSHKPIALVNKGASKAQQSQVALKPGQSLKVSPSLLGNKVIGFIDYDANARLRDFIDTDDIGRTIAWTASSHGYQLLKDNPDFRIRDQGNTIFAVLTANEIKTILPQLRQRISHLKLVVNAVDDAVTTLRKLEYQTTKLPIQHLDATSQRIVKDYFLTGTREDLRFAVNLMQHLFSVLMHSLLWVRLSLNRYTR